MKYQCLECGNKIVKLSQGRCPGCSSAAIRSLSRKTPASEHRQRSPTRVFLLVVLWSVLIYKAYELLL